MNDRTNLEQIYDGDEMARIYNVAVETALQSHRVTKYVKECEFETLFLECPAISDKYYHSGRKLRKGDSFIEWTLPGRDLSLPEKNSCGVKVVNVAESGMTACPTMEHYVKAKRLHCWSMHCPQCMNDTALRAGARIEKKLISYGDLRQRRGQRISQIFHRVISPPQDWGRQQVLTDRGYRRLCAKVRKDLLDVGMEGGVMVFHPWRLQMIDEKGSSDPENQKWVVGPHFHIVGYGILDTDMWLRENPGWLIKKIHSGQEIRSVRQTIGYLLTHVGLGRAETVFRDSFDYEKEFLIRFMDLFSPDVDQDIRRDSEYVGAGRNEVETLSGRSWYRGYPPEALSEVDWLELTKGMYSHTFQSSSYFGDLSIRRMQIVGFHQDDVVRLCPICGQPLGIYHACQRVEDACYKREIRIYSMAEDVETVRSLYLEFEPDLKAAGKNFLDFSLMIPQASSGVSAGLDEYVLTSPKKSEFKTIFYTDDGVGLK